MWLDGDSLYVVSTQWSYVSMNNSFSYAVINTQTRQLVCDNFITDGTDKDIVIPYAVAVNPITKDIYVTDAKDYVLRLAGPALLFRPLWREKVGRAHGRHSGPLRFPGQ